MVDHLHDDFSVTGLTIAASGTYTKSIIRNAGALNAELVVGGVSPSASSNSVTFSLNQEMADGTTIAAVLETNGELKNVVGSLAAGSYIFGITNAATAAVTIGVAALTTLR